MSNKTSSSPPPPVKHVKVSIHEALSNAIEMLQSLGYSNGDPCMDLVLARIKLTRIASEVIAADIDLDVPYPEPHTKKLSEAQRNYNQFIHSYNGESLLKEHSLSEVGTWNIYGEDPNCDLGGSHHEPYLETVHGSLDAAIRHAVQLKGWFNWGAGGSIRPVEHNKVTQVK